MRCTLVSLWMVFAASSASIAQQDQYACFSLPSPGGRFNLGSAVNEIGQVAGYTQRPGGGDFLATMWTDGIPIELGTLGPPSSRAEDVNVSGWAVGWSLRERDGALDQRAVLWRDGRVIDLGTLGGDDAIAHGINDAGEIVGHSYQQERPIGAFLWREEVMTNLGGFEEDLNAWALAVNNAGQVVGYAGKRADGIPVYRPSLWDEGRIIDLGTLEGNARSSGMAYAINDLGQIVGSSDDSYRMRATLWDGGQIIELGTIATREASAVAINNLGQIVGSGWSNNRLTELLLWDTHGGVQSIEQLMPPRATVIPVHVTDINDAGQIVGAARPRYPSQVSRMAFLMSPVHPSMSLDGPSPGVAGQLNTIIVVGVTPGEMVAFYYSQRGGGTRIPGCDLQQNALQLDNPTIIGTAIADANGVATITRNVPLIARGQTILFQAVVQNECSISQLVVHQFE